MAAEDVVDFHLDPGCPWTWLTSRWLVDVAEQRGFEVRWRPFSLALLNADRPTPPQFDTPAFRERMATGAAALRVITALGEAGDHESAGRFYAEFGQRFHDDGRVDGSVVGEASAAAGVDPATADGADVDDAIARGLEEALDLAGPDVGSPVLRIGGAERGFHGPIVSPRITGDEALAVFDAIAALQATSGFFEIKRGRSGGPDMASGQ